MATFFRGSLFLTIIFCVFLPPFLCSGAESTELEEVIVYGTGLPSDSTTSDLTVSTTVISLEKYRDRSTTVGELLDQAAGVRIQRFGGMDDFATVAIRGSSSEQVQIYLDGVPLNQGAGGAVNLATLPVESIEKITIFRGQAPARFATSAMGGVIAIETRKVYKKRISEARQRYGSLNSYTGAALFGGNFGSNRLLVSYQHSRSDGNFGFLDDNGTPANPSDDQRVRRRNNEFRKHNFVIRLGRRISEHVDIEFYNNLFHEERGVPGLGTLKSDEAHLTTTRNLTHLNITLSQLVWEGLTLNITPFFSVYKSQFEDLRGEIGLGRQDNDDDTFVYGNDFRVTSPWGRHQKWTFLMAYQGEEFRPQNFAAASRTGTPSIRHRMTLAIEDEIYLWRDRLILNPVLRMELIFNNLSGNDPSLSGLATPRSANQFPVSGKIGARLELPAGFVLRGSFGRAYRVPNFLELFGDRGATIGNPSLDPERSWNYDIGISWSYHGHSLRSHHRHFLRSYRGYKISATYFENRTNDLIQFLQNSQFTARATNLASATIRGVEFEVEALPTDFLTLTANYTFQRAKDTSGRAGFDGQFLPGRPVHQVNVAAVLSTDWGRFFSSLDIIDSNFLDSFNTREVRHRSLVSLGVSATPVSWITIGFEVKNLLNEQIEDVVGFPVPGRLFFGNLIFTI